MVLQNYTHSVLYSFDLLCERKNGMRVSKTVAEGGYFVTMLIFTKLRVSVVVGLKAIYE
jgi:hypothetical protein